MATLNFESAVGRVFFDGGTIDGKLIRKSKTYRNITPDAGADDLYKGLRELANLSSLPFMGMEKMEISSVND